MSLKIEMDKWDYKEACKAVQKLLDALDTNGIDRSVEILNIPSAGDIVDLIWEKINN